MKPNLPRSKPDPLAIERPEIGRLDTATTLLSQAERNLAEYETRLTAAESELRRVEARNAEISRRRTRASRMVSACRDWAKSQNVTLPDDEGGAVMVQGILPPAPRYTRDFISPGEMAAANASSPASAPSASASIPALSDDAPVNAFGQVVRRIRDAVGGVA